MRIAKIIFIGFQLISSIAWSQEAPWVGVTLQGTPCTGADQGYGPFDYKNRPTDNSPYNNLRMVEKMHFTPEVEGLIKGKSGRLRSDLDYTLRAWPNHHRALLSMIKYQLRFIDKQIKEELASPPECYFQRAIHFSPKDAATYSLFGHYLHKIGLLDKSVKYYEKALEGISKNRLL